jgi:hypothetical protein
MSSSIEERRIPRTFWSCVHQRAYSGFVVVTALLSFPSVMVSLGAGTVLSRKMCRFTPARLGSVRPFHNMKLDRFTRTAAAGTSELGSEELDVEIIGPREVESCRPEVIDIARN